MTTLAGTSKNMPHDRSGRRARQLSMLVDNDRIALIDALHPRRNLGPSTYSRPSDPSH